MIVQLAELWQNEAKIFNYFNGSVWGGRRLLHIAHSMTGAAIGGTAAVTRLLGFRSRAAGCGGPVVRLRKREPKKAWPMS
jgi:hypothetical protein